MSNIERSDEAWCSQCGQAGHTDEDDHGYLIEVAQRRWVELIEAEKQLRGAVSLAGEAADLLDELTVYWETDDLPAEVGSRFGEVRDALHHLGGQ